MHRLSSIFKSAEGMLPALLDETDFIESIPQLVSAAFTFAVLLSILQP